MNSIDQQLEKLRREWVKYPSRRVVIEAVAKSLKKRKTAPKSFIEVVYRELH